MSELSSQQSYRIMTRQRHSETTSTHPINPTLLLGVMLGVVWLGGFAGCGGNHSRGHYLVVFDEDVQGLSPEADVRCLGAPVGSITRLQVLESGQVQAEITIDPDLVPMRENMQAYVVVDKRNSTYLRLSPGSPDSSLLPPGGTLRGAVEPSLPLAIEGLPEVLQKVNGLLDRLEKAIGEPDAAVVADILRRSNALVLESQNSVTVLRQSAQDLLVASQVQIEQLSKRAGTALDQFSQTADAGRERLQTLSQESEKLLAAMQQQIQSLQLDQRSEELSKTLEDIRSLSTKFQDTSGAADTLISESRESLNRLEREMETTLRDTQSTLESARRLLDYLERDPAALLHGKQGAGTP